MNRNFNVVLPNSQQRDKNLVNIDISNLSAIINYSADTIACSCLELLDHNILEMVIGDILQKIKPGGQATFIMTDIKQYAFDFMNGTISGQDLLKKIKPINSIVTVEDIYIKLDTNTLKVAQVVKENKTVTVVVERISV